MLIIKRDIKIRNGKLFFLRHWQNDGDGLQYASHCVSVEPKEEWESFLRDLHEANEKSFDLIETKPYDGTVLDKGEAFEISVKDRKVKASYDAFMEALSHAAIEHKAEDENPNATVIKGISEDGREVYLISARTPLMQLRHRFMKADHVYKAIKNPVLTLPTKLDVVIVDDTMFFLTIAGAQMFVSDSICRKIAEEKVEAIKQVKFVTGLEHFEEVAFRGSNVRRFLGYNEQRMKKLKELQCRKKIAGKFGIKTKNSKLDLSDPADAERFIKVVCNRGMEDPFDGKAVEVSSSKPWEKKQK